MMTVTAWKNVPWRIVTAVVLAGVAIAACSDGPAWRTLNERLIKERGITLRTRDDMAPTGVASNLGPGVVTSLTQLADVTLYPGVAGKLYWGNGAMVCRLVLEPGAVMPGVESASERFIIMENGTVEHDGVDGPATLRMVPGEPLTGTTGARPIQNCMYLAPGDTGGLRAGPAGAGIIEVCSPPRLDYLAMAGIDDLPDDVTVPATAMTPTLESGRVYDVYDIQLALLTKGAHSRVVGGRWVQLSFLRMDPGVPFDLHTHPEEQVATVLRGVLDEVVLDTTTRMLPGDLAFLPSQIVHGGTAGDPACDALDVFWPVRQDYTDRMNERLAAYHAVIPADALLELVVDGGVDGPGLIFTEGPAWHDGVLYVSSMYFDRDFNGDPARSAIAAVSPDGSYRHISHGRMQSNGIAPLPGGTLAVCDMFGHRVVEMTTSGRVVRTLASECDGVRLDAPNDLAVDARGGIYFTDPQFIPGERKQPGRSVFYRRPDGTVVRVIEPGAFAMPNGVVLSPDGATLYVNNTYDDDGDWQSEKDNYVWAYDVADDGTLSGERPFAELYLSSGTLERLSRSSNADGMTVDELGNLYVCTDMGVQIIGPDGEFTGILNVPVVPVNCCFGGDDMRTLYIAAYSKIYRIRTATRGIAGR